MSKRLTLALMSLLVVGLAYEGLARIHYDRWRASFDNQGNFGLITIPSPNPVLMWEYKPYGRRPDAPPLRTNRWGFRERDYPSLTPGEGTRRIGFIGDSVTLGLGVTDTEAFPRRIEARLNAGDERAPYRSLNFGIDGYNTVQIHELLRTRVLDHEPELVVYAMSLNDFDFEDASGEKILYFRKPRSFLLRLLRRQISMLRAGDYYRRHFDRNRETVFAEIGAMRDLTNRRGIPLLVAVLPVFREGEDPALAEIHRGIATVLDGLEIDRVDLRPAFPEDDANLRDVSLDEWHPNARGHDRIAAALAPEISEQLRSISTDPEPDRSTPEHSAADTEVESHRALD